MGQSGYRICDCWGAAEVCEHVAFPALGLEASTKLPSPVQDTSFCCLGPDSRAEQRQDLSCQELFSGQISCIEDEGAKSCLANSYLTGHVCTWCKLAWEQQSKLWQKQGCFSRDRHEAGTIKQGDPGDKWNATTWQSSPFLR